MNIAGDDVLLPPTAEGKVFCTICKGGPMQVATIPFKTFYKCVTICFKTFYECVTISFKTFYECVTISFKTFYECVTFSQFNLCIFVEEAYDDTHEEQARRADL